MRSATAIPAGLERVLKSKLPGTVGPCYFRRLGPDYLLTNDSGEHAWLSEPDFLRFMSGKLGEGEALLELRRKGFIRDHMDFRALIERYARKNAHLRRAPGLHVFSLTLQNNQDTPYARAGAQDAGTNMALATVRAAVCFAFESPASELTLEIRGGEPLMNWVAVEFLVWSAREFAATAGRRLRLGLVSNLSLLDDEKLDFLMKNGVELCVPFDGPADLHDKHRGAGSHAAAARWLKTAAERYPDAPKPRAWLTVTRDSLGRAGEIVEEYVRHGFSEIMPRPLLPLGEARARWPELGVSASGYGKFYAECLGRVLELSRGGTALRERTAALLATKILKGEDPGFVELRSPSGGGLNQLAYRHTGEVYLSDEGRWLGEGGDNLFRLGGVITDYPEVVHHRTVKACSVASNLDAQPMCSRCAYKPFCGVSPVYNYAAQGTLCGRNPTNDRCAQYMGTFDLIFAALRDPAVRPILESWTEPSPRETEEPLPAFLTGGCQ